MLESFFIACAVAAVALAVGFWLHDRSAADPPPERGRGIYTGADRPVCSDCGASIDLGEPHGRSCRFAGWRA